MTHPTPAFLLFLHPFISSVRFSGPRYEDVADSHSVDDGKREWQHLVHPRTVSLSKHGLPTKSFLYCLEACIRGQELLTQEH